MDPQVIKLANAFSRVLRTWLTEDEIMNVNRSNAQNNDNCCASHDYCDANMAMDEAFNEVLGRGYVFFDDDKPETEAQNAADTDLINKAWAIAKFNHFNPIEL